MRFWIRIVCLLLSLFAAVGAKATDETTALWDAVRNGGHIVIMRHALAPGTGDPSRFQLDDCTTQRNLSAEGQQQARRTGQVFRDRGIEIGQVLSSQWCRCLETARLLDLGPVEPFPVLNSFFRQPGQGQEQTAELRRFVSTSFTGPSKVLITHQVNITGLTGVFPQSGEMLVLQPDPKEGFKMSGRIPAF
ncbi:MAG: histidine phosphatase family protein [Candidatus Competibacteraceae bacterium]|jgi:phosphohistidine phosphatase SixA|nr:histidine phosphatase family protein [Candidatus Competibacteraceae bacterium]